MIESQLKSRVLLGLIFFVKQNLLQPCPILVVDFCDCCSFVNNKLQTMIVFDAPHSLRYWWLLRYKNLLKSDGGRI